MSSRDQIKCPICAVPWPQHDTEGCEHGRKPAEYAAEPEPTILVRRKRNRDLIADGIVYQAVAAQLAVIERRIRWGWVLGYFYDEAAEQHDHYQVKVLRSWLQEHK